MEIDPRLRPPSDHSPATGGADTRHSYIASPASAQDDTVTSAHTTASDYPDPPSHFARESGNHAYYNTTGGQPQGSHPLYQAGQSASPVIPGFHRLESTDPNDPYADLKRPRACEACRQLKVRCEPDPINPNGPSCKRCAKAGRACVVTAPTRKRQKKTDSRVAELERKIDALTASLQASQGGDALFDQGNTGLPQREEHHGRRWLASKQNVSNGPPSTLGSPASVAGTKRRYSGEMKDPRENGHPPPPPAYPRQDSPSAAERMRDQTSSSSKRWQNTWFTLDNAPKTETKEFVDMIDRGLVTAHIASQAFDRYVEDMAPQLPVVVFPAGTRMEDVRRTKPVLLQAIVAVSMGPFQPELQMPLIDDFYKIIAERTVVKGEKSLELVQAILVSCNWYIPPDNFEELKFYQLVHLGVSIGMDIGMNQRTVASKPIKSLREILGRKPSWLDPDSPEIRRAWLGCYLQAVQMSISLRRVLLVRWQPYMDECLEILEKSPAALPSDKALIQWAKISHITEEVGFQFSPEELGSSASFSDPKTQYTLRVFEKQLDQWRRETPPDVYCATMRQSDYILNLCMHETAMQFGSNDQQTTPEDDYSSPTSAAHMNALSICLTSIHHCLDMVSSVDTRTFLSFPTSNLARTSYAMVALIKLYSLVSTPETRIGQVIDPASLKVEWYMDKVLERYRVAGSHPGGRTAAKFSVVLNLLRSWFMKRKDQHVALREAFDGGGKQFSICNSIRESAENNEERSQPAKMGPTPLHLLSEVAMGEPTTNRPNSRPASSQPRPGYTASEPIASSDLASQPLGPETATTTTAATDSDQWVQYPPVPISSASHAHSRPFYPSFSNPNYQDMPGYPDPNSGNMLMSTPNQGVFVPELGMQVGFDPENLFALGNMLGDGFFNLTFPLDGNAGYF
ncbi:hypothetical protein ASPWEDRAFT_582839 [Aspergillus wentii DTO 134E9]|uniref:Zn(2)-C6 fungal-type domain-containing protein n=1 Tax=Aspergillus wentii DTO 134E9 TaxID=1073089 RepID=A0A1L9RHW3_ASPWE|nr:uncharacterized protein ASPWEDRAFT_582839 [Aspergillus wentii DTO 134E9]OJJ34447.1 hypothetical protein ASPWEDRAFT_582839 [Aspergillus wentii DTO 134E9]